VGRFISQDSYEFSEGANFYAYTLNNPIRYTDPSGHQAIAGACVGCAIGAAVDASIQLHQGGQYDLSRTANACAVGGISGAMANYGGAVAGGGIAGSARNAVVAESSSRGADSAVNVANGARLSQQLRAEEIAGASLPSNISGYSKHGINQAISRNGVGVSTSAIQDTINNPIKIVGQSGGRFQFTGRDSVVVLNKDGKVITTWATNSAGVRQ
jgi:uncharacterized protein RhaS with RHS repeats